MIKENTKVVYPGHGVANVERIVTKNVAGRSARFYELKFLNKEMTILVPVDQAESVGLRPLSSREYIQGLFEMLSKSNTPYARRDGTAVNWNRRNKEYQEKLRTGNLHEICVIYRDLKLAEMRKDLSFGEKHLLQVTEGLLAEEISLVIDMQQDVAVNHIRTLITGSQSSSTVL